MTKDTAEKPNPNSDVVLFDFRTDWHLVRPHLNKPNVRAALKASMEEYFAGRKAECVANGLDPEEWTYPFDPQFGVWAYGYPQNFELVKVCSGCAATLLTHHNSAPGSEVEHRRRVVLLSKHLRTHWINHAFQKTTARLGLSKESPKPTPKELRRFNRTMREYYPKPDTVEWYQLMDFGCRWLAPWLKVLGEEMFPQYTWAFKRGEATGFAYGMDKEGQMRIIFDILHFENPVSNFTGADGGGELKVMCC